MNKADIMSKNKPIHDDIHLVDFKYMIDSCFVRLMIA